MSALQQLLDKVDRADLFFGVKVESVHTERFSGETALHIFAKWGNAEAIRTLVENGADLNKAGEDRNTPLHYAAMAGHLEAVQCLVKLGAKNLNDMYGNSPRHLAKGHPEVEAFLAENGF